jgi:AraC-like DNA-binding protein
MIKNIFTASLCLGIIFGIFFIIYTLFSKRSKDKPIVYLQLFVLFLTLHNLQIFITADTIDTNFLERKLLIPWYVLIIPAFYTFVRYFLKIEDKNKRYFWLALFLFSVEIIVRVCLFPNYFHDVKNLNLARYAQLEEIINASFTLFLFGKTFFMYRKKSKKLDYILSFDKLKWLNQFIFFGLLILATWVFAIVFNLKHVLNPEVYLYYPLRISTTFLICWVAYIGFFKYNLIVDRIEIRALILNDENYEVTVDQTKKEEEFLFIEQYINEHKCYLNPDFSLEEFVLQTKINGRRVSEILKTNTNSTFVEYINSLRIVKAKKLLLDKKYNDYNIATMGLECGFNSKSTFYRVFSKFVGKTPTDYIKENKTILHQ